MSRGISVGAFFLVLQYGLFMFVYPQSIIQSQSSGHWLVIVIGWLIQGALLRLLVGGLREDKTDLLAKFQHAGTWIRLCFVWPLIIFNLMAIGVMIRGHAQTLSMLYLPSTPLWVLFALLLVTALSIAYADSDSLLRLALVIGCFGIPLMLFSFLAALRYGNYLMIFPLRPTLAFLHEPKILPSIIAFVNVCGLIGFFGPYSASAKRWLWGAWLVSLFLFLANVYLPLSVLGQEVVEDLRFPLIVLLDTVRVKWFFFDRISLFYIMTIMFSTLINLSGLLWLTRQLALNSSFVPRLITNPAVMASLAIVVAYSIPTLEALEHQLRWGGPLRLGMLLILALIAGYYRNRTKVGGLPRA
ncbi:GerAB/ArcD/ProY family transporter [Paenibacillus sp. BK720]|uniref:GerAB/ArcD/ProY family transporter n=1 Tax=Paenibacillus sp. BK720 TaxID=2587092 RepID=UPI0014217EE1|nr:GerAB/ArcD/ProY family transporter [Paenibacillus sp. BK720]NIK68341.1 hypothetical protein [Paenibacillus sp. BK720]